MTTEAKVRALALALPEATEAPHFEATSFRIRKKIFATLGERALPLVVKLRPDQQAMMTETQPGTFTAIPGHWGRAGWTSVAIAVADAATIRHALTLAYCNVAPKKLAAALQGPGTAAP
ncbi:MAG: MmcQ/YjbR family DNA-binding protein [Alphaproteobacteria bacterium]|nr:MmcQ/YjbR family DNA-binding protein [Alphaproteobacteria bacterium]